jgi:hypothetical protein
VTMAWRIRMLLMWCQVRLVVISSNGGNLCHVNVVVIIYFVVQFSETFFCILCKAWTSIVPKSPTKL